MVRRIVVFGLVIAAVAVVLGGYTVAQEGVGPGAEGTPAALCATPVSDSGGQADGAGTPAASSDVTPCGTPDAGSTPVAAGPVVTVEFFDIGYTQTELTIPAETNVTLRFVNTGVAVHNFKIDEPKVYSDQLYGGDTVEITVNLPAGRYTYYCTIPGHRAAGMVGTLTVE